MVVLCDNVEGLMVVLPTFTTFSPLLLVEVATGEVFFVEAGASVLVETWVVTFEPSAFVVVTAIVVGTEVLEGCFCEVVSLFEVCCDVLPPPVFALCDVVPPAVFEVTELPPLVLLVVSTLWLVVPGVVDTGVVESAVLLVTGVVDAGVVVSPVPTTWRFGMTPSGKSSARIVAKPKRKASMIAASLGSGLTIGRPRRGCLVGHAVPLGYGLPVIGRWVN